jgi:hypothetical protein
MFTRILQALAILSAAAVVTALSMTWVVVSVVIPEDGLRLWIPAPIVLAQGAVALVGPPGLRDKIPLEPEHARIAAALLAELERTDDAELVRVESGEETVVVRKEGGLLRIEVDNPSERVRIHAPIREVREFLEECRDSPIEPSRIFRLARSLPSGPLVEYSEPGTNVSVRVW